MVCTPASQFCCGCSLKSGAMLVLVINLFVNLFLLIRAALSIFRPDSPLAVVGDLPMQVFSAAFCLAGLPFIAFGCIGMARKDEVSLRAYYFYLLLAMVVAGYFIVEAAAATTCGSLPRDMKAGGAFFCGMIQVVSIFMCTVLLGNMIYGLYIVWSLCQDVGLNVSTKFSDLEESYGSVMAKRLHEESHYLLRSHLDEGREADTFNASMGGYGKGDKIFGHKHELQYPPPVTML
eukprot:gb/GFBE01076740.1/.p1 GENE.gb/GFBE01076740.1/~~gb/GFBE01076740.1/.p1  ORF type:complete len:234 (+),score=61.23 gb/GFBE01076740.1/:1-702(+)